MAQGEPDLLAHLSKAVSDAPPETRRASLSKAHRSCARGEARDADWGAPELYSALAALLPFAWQEGGIARTKPEKEAAAEGIRLANETFFLACRFPEFDASLCWAACAGEADLLRCLCARCEVANTAVGSEVEGAHLYHLLHWTYQAAPPPTRHALKQWIGHTLTNFARHPSRSLCVGPVLRLVADLVRAPPPSSSQHGHKRRLSQAHRDLFKHVLLPLHRPNKFFEWRDQLPLLQTYHAPLMECLLLLLHREEEGEAEEKAKEEAAAAARPPPRRPGAPPLLLRWLVDTLVEVWPCGFEANTAKEVVLLHELESLLDHATPPHCVPGATAPGATAPAASTRSAGCTGRLFAGLVAHGAVALLPHVAACVGSENWRLAEKALGLWKHKTWVALICHGGEGGERREGGGGGGAAAEAEEEEEEESGVSTSSVAAVAYPPLLAALLRGGKPHWNPTVRRMTALVLDSMREERPRLFASAAHRVWPPHRNAPLPFSTLLPPPTAATAAAAAATAAARGGGGGEVQNPPPALVEEEGDAEEAGGGGGRGETERSAAEIIAEHNSSGFPGATFKPPLPRLPRPAPGGGGGVAAGGPRQPVRVLPNPHRAAGTAPTAAAAATATAADPSPSPGGSGASGASGGSGGLAALGPQPVGVAAGSGAGAAGLLRLPPRGQSGGVGGAYAGAKLPGGTAFALTAAPWATAGGGGVGGGGLAGLRSLGGPKGPRRAGGAMAAAPWADPAAGSTSRGLKGPPHVTMPHKRKSGGGSAAVLSGGSVFQREGLSEATEEEDEDEEAKEGKKEEEEEEEEEAKEEDEAEGESAAKDVAEGAGPSESSSGEARLLAFLEECRPEESEGDQRGWVAAQMAAAPTLLPSLRFHDLVFGHELGRGAFSTVKYARQIVKAPTGTTPTGTTPTGTTPTGTTPTGTTPTGTTPTGTTPTGTTPTAVSSAAAAAASASRSSSAGGSVRGRSGWPEFAVKVVSAAKLASAAYERCMLREVAILRSLGHPNVARMVSVFKWQGKGVYLVLEYAANGDLHGLITRNGSLAEASVRFLGGEMVAGLASIHDAGFVFGDLKPENVLLTEAGHVKLTDLGGARPYTAAAAQALRQSKTSTLKDIRDGDWRAADAGGEEDEEAQGQPGPAAAAAAAAGGGAGAADAAGAADDAGAGAEEEEEEEEDARVEGTTAYCAPEVVRGGGQGLPSVAADAWALGCTLYFALRGKPPFFHAHAADDDGDGGGDDGDGGGGGGLARDLELKRAIVAFADGVAGGGGGGVLEYPPLLFSASAQALVQALLEPRPANRLGFPHGARDVAKHFFFTKHPTLGRPAGGTGGSQGGGVVVVEEPDYCLRLHEGPAPPIVVGSAPPPPKDAKWARRQHSHIWAPELEAYDFSDAGGGSHLAGGALYVTGALLDTDDDDDDGGGGGGGGGGAAASFLPPKQTARGGGGGGGGGAPLPTRGRSGMGGGGEGPKLGKGPSPRPPLSPSAPPPSSEASAAGDSDHGLFAGLMLGDHGGVEGAIAEE